MHQLVVTLDCPDRPGIVHAITAGIVAAGGNITELQQFSSPDSGHFFTRIEVDGSESDELTRAIAETTAGFDARLRVRLLPDWETLAYDSFSPHHDLVSERLATLYSITRSECAAATRSTRAPTRSANAAISDAPPMTEAK